MRSIISAASGAAADVLLHPGDIVPFGSFALRALATPGHTDGCLSYYLPRPPPGAAPAAWPGMAFTGDALLIRGCGRCDFQQGDARRLYESVHTQLFTLPEDTLVYPAHEYKVGGGQRGRRRVLRCEKASCDARGGGPLQPQRHHAARPLLERSSVGCPGSSLQGRSHSTISEEQRHNLRLTRPLDEFVSIMNGLGLPRPKRMDVAVPANMCCGAWEAPEPDTLVA